MCISLACCLSRGCGVSIFFFFSHEKSHQRPSFPAPAWQPSVCSIPRDESTWYTSRLPPIWRTRSRRSLRQTRQSFDRRSRQVTVVIDLSTQARNFAANLLQYLFVTRSENELKICWISRRWMSFLVFDDTRPNVYDYAEIRGILYVGHERPRAGFRRLPRIPDDSARLLAAPWNMLSSRMVNFWRKKRTQAPVETWANFVRRFCARTFRGCRVFGKFNGNFCVIRRDAIDLFQVSRAFESMLHRVFVTTRQVGHFLKRYIHQDIFIHYFSFMPPWGKHTNPFVLKYHI